MHFFPLRENSAQNILLSKEQLKLVNTYMHTCQLSRFYRAPNLTGFWDK